MKSYFSRWGILTAAEACFELVKHGKVSYAEFSKMSLEEMEKRVDEEISKADNAQKDKTR